ncbi:uncharacterized protein IUM83_02633 [Phytophthora cinnamomi]|uniref:uncharacterized protein n=1 Tax=Phytophthora cinnamomi TaxID=4785 RepID=UPI00355A8437|nr:hypothetical protein IUM83_02633 [Phytophthora cinnamomi]
MQVLFVTEYIVLVEYTEAILPIIYSLNRAILIRLPNSAYYPSLAELSHAQLASAIMNVLAYGTFELASLVVTIVVLKRTLGLSSWRQLGFVLDKQAGMVQAKLIVWFLYIMQISLVHLGADFSFKFEWITHNKQ